MVDTSWMKPRQRAVFEALSGLNRAVTSPELYALLQKDDQPRYPEASMYDALTVLRRRGIIKRRAPSEDEVAVRMRKAKPRQTPPRWMYEIGSGSEYDEDPRARDSVTGTPAQRLNKLYERREELVKKLKRIDMEIDTIEAQTKRALTQALARIEHNSRARSERV
jgi:hypothetical protein